MQFGEYFTTCRSHVHDLVVKVEQSSRLCQAARTPM